MKAFYKINLAGNQDSYLAKGMYERQAKRDGMKVFKAIKKSLIEQYGADFVIQDAQDQFTTLTVKG